MIKRIFGLFFKKSLFCFSLLTPVGGGIPHGVFPEMGPGGNVGQLTEHRPRWAGTHETAQSSPDTKQKRSKAQADTEAREGAGVASSGCPMESKNHGRKRGSVSWAPDLAKDLVSESVSDSVSGSLTDIAAHLNPVPAAVQDQAVETVNEPETKQARKSSVGASANRETARPRRESAGEHRSETEILFVNSETNHSIDLPPPPTYTVCTLVLQSNKRSIYLDKSVLLHSQASVVEALYWYSSLQGKSL